MKEGLSWEVGVSVVWAEKRRRSPAMTEGGVKVMITEGGVEVQLERKARQRERERRSPAITTEGGVEDQLEREARQGIEREKDLLGSL